MNSFELKGGGVPVHMQLKIKNNFEALPREFV